MGSEEAADGRDEDEWDGSLARVTRIKRVKSRGFRTWYGFLFLTIFVSERVVRIAVPLPSKRWISWRSSKRLSSFCGSAISKFVNTTRAWLPFGISSCTRFQLSCRSKQSLFLWYVVDRITLLRLTEALLASAPEAYPCLG